MAKQPLPVTSPEVPRREQSERYREAALKIIAGGVNSNIRLASQPFTFSRGQGSKLVDLDDNEYIDYALGMGPVILGHAPDAVIRSVAASLETGQLFAGQHPLELELAQLLQRFIPSAERVRVGLSGSEMVQAALRVARAHTDRRAFVKFEGHYHGWFDNVLVNIAATPGDPSGPLPFPVHRQSAGQSASAAAETYVLPWNNLDAVARLLAENESQIAAILTEPVMCNTGAILPREGYLEGLRELCDKHGVVFIMDEVITGFRLGMDGAQGLFGVMPDLSVFAKAFGGGFPVAALVGRAEIMDRFASGEVNHSGTYNANLVSIAAGIATLKALADDGGAVYRHIEKIGGQLIDGIRQIAGNYRSNLKVSGYGSVFHTFFCDEDVHDYASYRRSDAAKLKALLDALLIRGIRPTNRGTWFVSAAHTEDDVDRTLAAIDGALRYGI